MSSRVAPKAWALWRWALLVGMGSIGGLYVVYAVLYFTFPIVDRGWVIDHIVHNAWQMVQGQPVYVDPLLGSPTAFMYTPGLTFMVAPLVALFGPELWTARLVNLIAVVLLFVILTRETARRVADRRLVWFAPGLIFLIGASYDNQTLLMVHPDNWALVWSFLALIAARRAAKTGRGLLWVVLASFAAVVTKQTMLIFTVAAAAPLLVSRRPARAALYLVGVAGLLAAGAAWGQHVTDGHFLQYVLLATRQQVTWTLVRLTPLYIGYRFGPALLVLAVALLLNRRRARLAELLRDPFLTAVAIALPVSHVLMAKTGATVCNLLPLALLLVPLTLQAVDALLPWLADRPRRAATAAVACLLWVTWSVSSDLRPRWQPIAAHGPALQAARRLDEVVRTARRPVWVPFDISLAYGNGVPVVTPLAILGEYRFDPEVYRPILAQLDAGAFETILLRDDVYDVVPEALFAPVLRARYRPVELIETSHSTSPVRFVAVLERRH